jgi:Domain of unknown function (DUF4345)
MAHRRIGQEAFRFDAKAEHQTSLDALKARDCMAGALLGGPVARREGGAHGGNGARDETRRAADAGLSPVHRHHARADRAQLWRRPRGRAAKGLGYQGRRGRPDPDFSRADVPPSRRLDLLGVAAFKPDWQHVAAIWAIVFCFSLALGRVISLIVDGPASWLLDLYLALEISGGLLGLAALAYARKSAA